MRSKRRQTEERTPCVMLFIWSQNRVKFTCSDTGQGNGGLEGGESQWKAEGTARAWECSRFQSKGHHPHQPPLLTFVTLTMPLVNLDKNVKKGKRTVRRRKEHPAVWKAKSSVFLTCAVTWPRCQPWISHAAESGQRQEAATWVQGLGFQKWFLDASSSLGKCSPLSPCQSLNLGTT